MSERVSLWYLRDAMRSGFDSILLVLKMLFPLIQKVDDQLYRALEASVSCIQQCCRWRRHRHRHRRR